MAATALEVTNGQKVVTITTTTDNGLYISLYQADENYKPIGVPEEFGNPATTEEQFHKNLRKEANEKGHYRPRFSTNPDWNPEYVEPSNEVI